MSKGILRRATKVFLVSCNVLVSLLQVAGCYAAWFNPQKYWFLGLFTLASFYFLLIQAGFVIFWLFVKKGLTLISIIGIIIVWKPLQEVLALRAASEFRIMKNASDIRLMSWNVEHFDILEHRTHPERKQQMISLINEYQPDIACFEEMVASDSFPSAINYMPDFMNRLAMPEYHYSYNQKLDFDRKHHFGIIIFSRFPIINKRTISFAPYNYNSSFQYVDIVKGPDTFRVFNIHMQSLKFTRSNRSYIEDPSINDERDIEESKSVITKLKAGFLKRHIQSDRIKHEMNNSPYPVIVCGDFNDVPNSYSYHTIGKGMKNAFTEKGSGIGRTFYSISPTLRIDNIFVDKGFTVKQYTAVKKKLSDHFPILADVEYTK